MGGQSIASQPFEPTQNQHHLAVMAQAEPRQGEMEMLIEAPEASASSSVARRVGVVVGVLGMAGALAAVALPGARSGSVVPVDSVMQKEERIAITPSFPQCSKGKENCMNSACCKVSGHTCYRKNYQIALCNETCTPGKGWLCDSPYTHSVPVQTKLDLSLYCFSVYTKDTGSTKHSFELDLLKEQKKHGVSIFSCGGWDVFSDVRVDIGGGYSTELVQDVNNEFHQIKRKVSGAWVNWGMFYQVWLQVRFLGKWETKSWTVKVDPDAVFLPNRLQGWLGSRNGESPHGVYFENCKNVQYGFFGNLEVMSHEATNVLTKYLEDCHAVYAPCANDGCDWQYGAWGEDVFVQRCLDRHYVDKVEAFDMTLDGACAADRPEGQKKNKKWHAEDCSEVTTAAVHPFKTPKEYFRCLSQMTAVRYD